MTYRITVELFKRDSYTKVITFTVDDYELKEGMVFFFDKVDKVTKAFPTHKCQIEGVKE